tara:strand:+ start:361 stop:852 length:492 start_codon:yes stop_codon:yes gene_type:complete
MLVVVLAAISGTAQAQIRDNETSQSLLAVQCSLSSGFPASNYEEYCRKLAKTVGILDSGQQERVFGYVPDPIAYAEDVNDPHAQYSSSGGYPSDSNQNTGDAGVSDSYNYSEGASKPGSETETAPENTNDWWGGFFSWLGQILNGDDLKNANLSDWTEDFKAR